MNYNRDILGGGLLVSIGLFVGIYTLYSYDIGGVARMGPGMMPAVLSALLIFFGCQIALPALFQPSEPVNCKLRPVLAIFSAFLVFGLTLERLGIVVSVSAMTLCATQADPAISLKARLTLAALLVGIATVIFPVGLGLPIPIFAWAF